MKIVTLILSTFLIILIDCSCSKNVDNRVTTFVGKWTLTEVYGNDYWGGPAYWKNVDDNTKIEFTTDGKYFKKYVADSTYTFIGTYQILSDSTIQFKQANPVNPSYPDYVLNYTLSKGSYMTWGIFGYEGIIKEKYKLDK